MPRKKKTLDLQKLSMSDLEELSSEIGEYFKDIAEKAGKKGNKYLTSKGLKDQLEFTINFDVVPKKKG